MVILAAFNIEIVAFKVSWVARVIGRIARKGKSDGVKVTYGALILLLTARRLESGAVEIERDRFNQEMGARKVGSLARSIDVGAFKV